MNCSMFNWIFRNKQIKQTSTELNELLNVHLKNSD